MIYKKHKKELNSLEQIGGIGKQYAEYLRRCGILTINALVSEEASVLVQKMHHLLRIKKFEKLPTEKSVNYWIKEAKAMLKKNSA